MPVQNDFLPVAIGGVPNVAPQATYAAAVETLQGYAYGEVVDSAILNKMLRQSSCMAAIIAMWIVAATGQPVIDDGNDAAKVLLLQSMTRTRLFANTTYHVGPTGSDVAGDGSVGNPWLTPGHAWSWTQANLDLNGWQLQILAADNIGSAEPIYPALSIAGAMVGQTSPVLITGNIVTVANCIMAGVSQGFGSLITLQGFHLTSVGSSNISTAGGGGCNFGNIEFAGAPTVSHIHCDVGGTAAQIGATAVFSGTGAYALCDGPGSRFNQAGATTQHVGAIVYTGAFVEATTSGALIFSNGAVFTGTVPTGAKYLASNGGVVNSGGGGVNFFPGSAGGSSATGYYV